MTVPSPCTFEVKNSSEKSAGWSVHPSSGICYSDPFIERFRSLQEALAQKDAGDPIRGVMIFPASAIASRTLMQRLRSVRSASMNAAGLSSVTSKEMVFAKLSSSILTNSGLTLPMYA
jgi:hypothetical protein